MPIDGNSKPGRHRTPRDDWHVRIVGPLITAEERRRYLGAAVRIAGTFAVVGAVGLSVGWAMGDQSLGRVAWYVGAVAATLALAMLLLALITCIRPGKQDRL